MIVRPWQKGDTEKLQIQGAQEYISSIVNVDYDFTELSFHGLAWTGEADDAIVIVAGLVPQWEDRALAWALVSKDAGDHFTSIHRAVKKFLIHCGYRRVEANIDVGFKAGHRWIKMLGFELEGLMKAYRPDGKDMFLYARVRR